MSELAFLIIPWVSTPGARTAWAESFGILTGSPVALHKDSYNNR